MSQEKHQSSRILISMRKPLLDVLDKFSQETGKSRSEFIRDAIRFYVKDGSHLNLSDKDLLEATNKVEA